MVINGKGDTATIAGPAYPEDEGLDIIRSHPTKHEGCYRRIRRSQKSRVKAGKKKVVLPQRRTDFGYGYRRRLRPAFALRAVFDSSAFSVPDESNFAVTLSLIHF